MLLHTVTLPERASAMDTISAFITLVFVMDPVGNIPLFLSVLKDVDAKRRQWIIFRELMIALVILLIFLYGGDVLLNMLGLRQEWQLEPRLPRQGQGQRQGD